MAISKLILNGVTQMDVTGTTANASRVLNTYKAIGSDGVEFTGQYVPASPSLQAKTNISPTTSSQTITADNGYDGLSSVQINAMPSGTAGTPSATKGAVSNHSISVTPSVTNTTGYITGGTKTGTAVTVSASELVSGTLSVTSSGTKDVTNYASASVPALTLPSNISSTSSGTKKANIISSVNETRYLNIPAGYNDTAQYYQLNQINLETLNVTQNGTYYPEDTGFSVVNVNVSGGGGGTGNQVGTVTASTTSTGSLTFTGLLGQPTSFIISSLDTINTASLPNIATVCYDGTSIHGQGITTTSNANVSYLGAGPFNLSYDSGTLSVYASGASFVSGNDYKLVYTYGGNTSDIHTADVQVGSGATSITFTGLSEEPLYFSCIFKSNFSTSSGYQRVITAVYDGSGMYGLEMDSSAKYSNAHWSYTYSNGSLTITSQGTNAGGYFHQPGYYQLTYAVGGEASNYQSKTVTPTTSQQIVTADEGYDALRQVTVNAMPTMTLPSSTSETSSGTSKATITPTSSTQYLNIPTGYNSTAQYYTISASGGGGSSSIATTTWTNSTNTTTSHQFTNLSGTPIAAFLRCTSSLSRSSSSSNYFIADMFWDGSTCKGNSYRRSNGNYANVTSGYSVTTGTKSITFTSSGTSTTNPGSFYNGTYELVYIY